MIARASLDEDLGGNGVIEVTGVFEGFAEMSRIIACRPLRVVDRLAVAEVDPVPTVHQRPGIDPAAEEPDGEGADQQHGERQADERGASGRGLRPACCEVCFDATALEPFGDEVSADHLR